MNKKEIEGQLKLSKKQNKNKRYDYLGSQFNCVNYAINLEKYTNKLQQQNKKYKEVIDKAIDKLQLLIDIGFDYDGFNKVDSLKTLIDELVGYAIESKDILRGGINETRQY